MGRALEVAYLDTQILVWLAGGAISRLTKKAATAIDETGSLLISPMVMLELQYLYERNRISVPGSEVISFLEKKIDLQLCRVPMARVMHHALDLGWTRDPFDRIIVAQAASAGAIDLITADENIREHYPAALWD